MCKESLAVNTLSQRVRASISVACATFLPLRRSGKTGGSTFPTKNHHVAFFAAFLALASSRALAFGAEPASSSVDAHPLPPGAVSQFMSSVNAEEPSTWGTFSPDARLFSSADGLWDVSAGHKVKIAPLTDGQHIYLTVDNAAYVFARSDDTASFRALFGKSPLVPEASFAIPYDACVVQFKKELLIRHGGGANRVVASDMIANAVVSEIDDLRIWQAIGRVGSREVSASPDGRHVVIRSDVQLYLWDLRASKAVGISTEGIPIDKLYPAGIVFSMDGERLADFRQGFRRSDSATVQVLDARTAARLCQIGIDRSGHSDRGSVFSRDPIFSGFSPDHAQLFYSLTALGDLREPFQIHKLDVALSREVGSVSIRTSSDLIAFACSRDGRCLQDPYGKAISCFVDSGFPRSHLAAALAHHFAMSADGRIIATTDSSGTVSLCERAGRLAVPVFDAGHQGAESPLFSRDGRRLATRNSGTRATATVWDLTFGAADSGEVEDELKQLWSQLASFDFRTGRRAVWRLAGNGDAALQYLSAHLSAATVDGDHVRRLIVDLDASTFANRERAAKELEMIGPAARPALHDALNASPSPQVRAAIERLFKSYDVGMLQPETLRRIRAIEVLERVGGKKVEAVIARLAGGASGAMETDDAVAALERLRNTPP